MDAVLNKIQQHSNPQKFEELQLLENYLNKHEDTIDKNDKAWTPAISMLTPNPGEIARCTMGLIWIASVRSRYKEENPVQGTLHIVEALILHGDYKQIANFCPTAKHWGNLIRNYTKICRQMDLYRRGMYFMTMASAKFTVNHSTMTPAHQCLVFLALKGNNPKAVVPLCNKPIFEVDPDLTGVNVQDYMKYYLYGALTYIGVHKYKKAQHFLETCLSTPAQCSSAIMIEAYKVYLLLGIIANGKVFGIPMNACNALERSTRQLCAEYSEFAAVCETMDREKIHKAFMENRGTFMDDGMLGLAIQASYSIVKQHIHALTKTYVTLNLKQMADQVGVSLQEVEAILLDMVEEGTLQAKINRQDGMVSFIDEKKDDVHTLEERLSQLQFLAQRIENLDEIVSLSEPYVTEKLRSLPNYRELLQEYEIKRKQSRGMMEKMQDFFTN